jgi:crossover junction endodeoxyribonuclease RuvC
MIVLGIDPGLSGAIALIDTDLDHVEVEDIPTFKLTRNGKVKNEIDISSLARSIDAWNNYNIDHCFIEAVGAMPGQGVSSVFSFGKTFGILLGIVAANFIPTTLVTPQTWKRALKVPADKDGARARASQIDPYAAVYWPLKKHDGRAEAFLIAHYGVTVSK